MILKHAVNDESAANPQHTNRYPDTILQTRATRRRRRVLIGSVAGAIALGALITTGIPTWIIVGAFAIGMFCPPVSLENMWDVSQRSLREDRPCPTCQHSLRELSTDASGVGTCPECGEQFRQSWYELPLERPSKLSTSFTGEIFYAFRDPNYRILIRGMGRRIMFHPLMIFAILLLVLSMAFFPVMMFTRSLSPSGNVVGWLRLLPIWAILMGASLAFGFVSGSWVRRRERRRLIDAFACSKCQTRLEEDPVEPRLLCCPNCHESIARYIYETP